MGPEILQYALIFIVALAALLKASDWFVESAERIGLSLGISPFIIGVTIVAFGTSLPELASSIAAVLEGESEIVTGNVIGSNITNIVLVLGLVAMVAKRVPVDFKNMDLALLIGSAMMLWFVITTGNGIDLWEAILFLVCLVMFLINTFNSSQEHENEERPRSRPRDYVLLVVGAALVWLGATYTVSAIQGVCEITGVSSGFVAQTVVALGTSLPEVVVSISAARKGQSSIAVGNVIGSNVFNTYAVMGIARLFGDLVIEPGILSFSLPLMVCLTVMLAALTLTSKISRWEGGLLLVFYVFFLVQTILAQM
jgi:cation:H+ antiporter